MGALCDEYAAEGEGAPMKQPIPWWLIGRARRSAKSRVREEVNGLFRRSLAGDTDAYRELHERAAAGDEVADYLLGVIGRTRMR